MLRGRQVDSGTVLLDAFGPGKDELQDIFPEILRLVAGTADAIFFRPRPGLDYCECSPLDHPPQIGTAEPFVITPEVTARSRCSGLRAIAPCPTHLDGYCRREKFLNQATKAPLTD